jgi:hypothetical protein
LGAAVEMPIEIGPIDRFVSMMNELGLNPCVHFVDCNAIFCRKIAAFAFPVPENCDKHLISS